MFLNYASRSMIYMKCKQFIKCLIDINAALECNVSTEQKMELLVRKMTCLQLIDSYEQTKSDYEFKLTRPAHPKIPFVANCLEIKNDEKYGNHVITTEELVPGEIILVESFFFYTISDMHTADPSYRDSDEKFDDVYYQLCAHCLNANLMCLFPCSGCTHTMYCSKKCQNEAFSYHSMECESFDKFLGRPALVMRSFFQALAICNNDISELESLIKNHAENGSPHITMRDLDYTTLSEEENKRRSVLMAYSGISLESGNPLNKHLIEAVLRHNSKTSEMMDTHSEFILSFIEHLDKVQSTYAHCFSKTMARKNSSVTFAGKVQSIVLTSKYLLTFCDHLYRRSTMPLRSSGKPLVRS
jgi:hypothetical protein